MPGEKLSHAKRVAAARVLFAAFGVCNQICNLMLYFDAGEWGTNVFTEKEKDYLTSVREHIHKDGEALRKLGWRLVRS